MVDGARPNILLITADDMNADTPGCCGGPADVTPTIDRLAAEGLRFQHGHVTIAVCQPSRSVLMTGRYPHRNGAEGFEAITDGVPLLTEWLDDAGYRCGILGKVTHIQPVERFRWQHAVDFEELGWGRNPERYAEETAAFLEQTSAEGRPFFLMVNTHDPHRPFHGSDQEADTWNDRELATFPDPSRIYGPDEWPRPGFLPDLPEVRTETAEYLSSCRRADDVIAGTLAELHAAGVADTTLVMFLSDNGMAFPFAKTNCYLHSTRTPWIVRWPGRVAPGQVDTEHFVTGIDLAPTVLDAVGLPIPDGFDGSSFLPLLDGATQDGRDQIVTVFHETAFAVFHRLQGNEGKGRYEMRAVQDHRWGYIWNSWSDGEYRFRNESMTGRSWDAMEAAAAADPAIAARADFYLHRTPEELYDFAADPDALDNLIDRPDLEGVRAELRSALRAWMVETADPLRARFEDRTPS